MATTTVFRSALPFTLRFIAIVQVVLGLGFSLAPESTAALLGLTPAPGWANWLLGMMAARFLAFGYGMWMAARAPEQAHRWIGCMVFIQAVDWLVTVKYLYQGAVTLAQVSTASFLPLIFIVMLWLGRPASSTTTQQAA